VALSKRDEKVIDGAGPEPHLELPARTSPPRAAVLVLHGGKADSLGPVESHQLTVRRMQPFARDLAALGDDLVVAQLRYRVRGWNSTGDDALADVAYALDAVGTRYGALPVVVVGHSMGGRAALRAAGHASVRGVVALAPWLPAEEPVSQLAGRDVVVLHGTRDLTTSPGASARFVERAAPVARSAVCLHVPWSGHGMLLRASTWHRLTAAFVAAMVDDAALDRPVELALAAGCREVGP
jgi:pimeloyl-ACP methyl ester carboxylesterase